MDDENEDVEEEMSVAERHDQINRAQHQIETKRTALTVLNHASELRRLGDASVVCDDQRDVLEDAADRVEDAADAIWPGGEGVPDLADLDSDSGGDGGE